MEEVVKAHPAFPFFVAMACDKSSLLLEKYQNSQE
jgi:hypothetical protein